MGDFGGNAREQQVITSLDKVSMDLRRCADALERILALGEWYTSGDTTTLDALANKLDDLDRRIVALEGA